MALEQYFRKQITLQQLAEQLALEEKHVAERRAKAREQHLLVDKPEDFDHEILWETQPKSLGYKVVLGYSLEDMEYETPSQTGYWCGDCKGWVKGEPIRNSFNTISFLSGS